MAPELDYHAIRQRVDERTRRLRRWAHGLLLFINIALFAGGMFLAWGAYLYDDGKLPGWQDFNNLMAIDLTLFALILLSGGWGVAIVIHIVAIFLNTRISTQPLRDWLIGREINRELGRLGMDEASVKEKAKRMLRLSDDGELQEVVDEAAELEINRQHHA